MHDMHQAVRSEGEIFGGLCPPSGMDLMVTVINETGYTICFLPLHELQDWVDIVVHLFSPSPSSSAQEYRKKLIWLGKWWGSQFCCLIFEAYIYFFFPNSSFCYCILLLETYTVHKPVLSGDVFSILAFELKVYWIWKNYILLKPKHWPFYTMSYKLFKQCWTGWLDPYFKIWASYYITGE